MNPVFALRDKFLEFNINAFCKSVAYNQAEYSQTGVAFVTNSAREF